eukprot:GHUV01015059.1.p1 GENE.GHUV01015059.1~~GHUV01015059.1.p1  ORF type:complete len:119 (-),score=23.03 GHUV01015059.1:146-502(-)
MEMRWQALMSCVEAPDRTSGSLKDSIIRNPAKTLALLCHSSEQEKSQAQQQYALLLMDNHRRNGHTKTFCSSALLRPRPTIVSPAVRGKTNTSIYAVVLCEVAMQTQLLPWQQKQQHQ